MSFCNIHEENTSLENSLENKLHTIFLYENLFLIMKLIEMKDT